MKRFSKLFLLGLILIAAVSCSVTSAETGDIKEVKVPAAVQVAPVQETAAQETPAVETPVTAITETAQAETQAPVTAPAPVEITIVEETAKIWHKQFDGQYLIIAAYDDIAYVMVPAGVTTEDVFAFIDIISEDFGPALDGVTIGPSDIADYEIRGLSKESATVAMQILDMYFDHYYALLLGEKSVQNAKITIGEDGALNYTMYANGQEVVCTFYQGHAYISFPEEVSLENILMLRDALLLTYSNYLEGTTVDYVEDGLLVVTYPDTVDYSNIVSFLSASKADVPVLTVILPQEEIKTVIEVASAPEKQTVKETVSEVVETVKETAEKAVETVKETTQKAVETVTTKASEVVSSIDLPQEVEAKSSSALSVILIVIVVLLVAACAYYFLVYRKKK